MESFQSLSEWMKEKNSAYYKSPKTRIYRNFSTYAQSPQGKLACANAAAFHARMREAPKSRYEILEVGVGEGAFAQGFLQELFALDKKHGTDIANRVHYVLSDFSAPLLSKAAERLKKQGLGLLAETFLWDASQGNPLPAKSYDLIRCNELLSDLPADAYMRQENNIMEAKYDKGMKLHLMKIEWEELDDLEQKLMQALPQGYIVPINRAALKALSLMAKALGKNGRIDAFDYGFYKKEDFEMPAKIWNETIVREFAGQWTVDLNFIYLAAALAMDGLRAKVQMQQEYVNRWIAHSSKSVERKAAGLDYSLNENNEIKEDDFFYHLEIKK